MYSKLSVGLVIHMKRQCVYVEVVCIVGYTCIDAVSRDVYIYTCTEAVCRDG